MKKLLALIVFCLVFTPPIVRAEWVYSGANSSGTDSYFDLDSIRNSKGKISAWVLYNYNPHLKNSPEVLSLKELLVIDCDFFSFRSLTSQFFSEHDGYGENIETYNDFPEKIQYAAPESQIYGQLKMICDHVENKM